MMNDAVGLDCNVTIEVREATTGRLLRTQRRHNLVTLAGRNLLRDALKGVSSPYTLTHLAVGTGTDAAASGDTTLQTEVFRDVLTKTTSDAGKLTAQYYLSSTSANGSTLTEAGLLTAASGGTLFARVTFAGIEKSASLTVTFIWDININAG
jgi:hypothetical protein